MEQLYLVEMLVDKMTVYPAEDDFSGADKKFTINIKFGPKAQTIVTEGKLGQEGKSREGNAEGSKPESGTVDASKSKESAPEMANRDDIIECGADGIRKWSRTIRYGKSYLFSSCPDGMLGILSKFPLDIEVWDDDPKDDPIYVAIGVVKWDKAFFEWLDETSDPRYIYKPKTVKQKAPLMADCCCRRCGEISFIVRITTLGSSVTTEFQEINANEFCFRTNKAPTMFKCHKYDMPNNDNPDFLMIGSLFETATLEDPDVIGDADQKIEICTELQPCGIKKANMEKRCHHIGQTKPSKKYQIESIRMGDITGPCGNANCALAHKIRTYIRGLDQYKKETAGKSIGDKEKRTPCGACICKDEKWHRQTCVDYSKTVGKEELTACPDCGTMADKKHDCTNPDSQKCSNAKPELKTTTANYMISTTRIPKSLEYLFGADFTVNVITDLNRKYGDIPSSSRNTDMSKSCCYKSRSSHSNLSPNTVRVVTNAISTPTIPQSSKNTSSVYGSTLI